MGFYCTFFVLCNHWNVIIQTKRLHALSSPQIIQRRKRSEMQTEYDFVWPQPQSLIQPSELSSPSQAQAPSQEPQDPIKTSYSLWVSLCLQAKLWNMLLSQNQTVLSWMQTAESQPEGFTPSILLNERGFISSVRTLYGLNYGGTERKSAPQKSIRLIWKFTLMELHNKLATGYGFKIQQLVWSYANSSSSSNEGWIKASPPQFWLRSIRDTSSATKSSMIIGLRYDFLAVTASLRVVGSQLNPGVTERSHKSLLWALKDVISHLQCAAEIFPSCYSHNDRAGEVTSPPQKVQMIRWRPDPSAGRSKRSSRLQLWKINSWKMSILWRYCQPTTELAFLWFRP